MCKWEKTLPYAAARQLRARARKIAYMYQPRVLKTFASTAGASCDPIPTRSQLKTGMLAVGSALWKIAEGPAPIEMVEARRAIIRPLIEENMQFVEANFVLDYKPTPAQPEANEVGVPVEEGTSSKRQLHKTCFHASHPL